jgi:hypothetical protein
MEMRIGIPMLRESCQSREQRQTLLSATSLVNPLLNRLFGVSIPSLSARPSLTDLSAYFKDHDVSFDGVAINPPLVSAMKQRNRAEMTLRRQVLGEMIHECENVGTLNTSLGKSIESLDRTTILTTIADLYQYAAGLKSEQELKEHIGIINWVNVKDRQSGSEQNSARSY